MSATIRKKLSTLASILFIGSTLGAIFWEFEIDGRRFAEDFPYLSIQPGNGEPGRLFDNNLHCPSKVARGERLTIAASITNPGASADYEVTLWDEEMYESRYSVPPSATLCSTTVRIRGRDTIKVTCDVTAPQENRLWQVIVWAVSSEDNATFYTSRRSNSYFGICQIHVGAYTTDYLSSPVGIFSLGGVVVSAALWFLARRQDRKLISLRTVISAFIGILVWLLPFWYEILRLGADAPFWLGYAPILACILWIVLFFGNMLRQ